MAAEAGGGEQRALQLDGADGGGDRGTVCGVPEPCGADGGACEQASARDCAAGRAGGFAVGDSAAADLGESSACDCRFFAGASSCAHHDARAADELADSDFAAAWRE